MNKNKFLVRVSISLWTARKLDKNATRDAKERAGAGDKAGVKVYKSLVAADALDAIEKIANKARVEHKRRTVPWAYDGPGAITSEGYPGYKATMAELEKAFHVAVAKFYTVYEQEREAARVFLGGMFNLADYPTVGSLSQRFAFSVSAEPMPEAQDFRVDGLAPELVAEIQQDIEANQERALNDANATAWGRVIEAVEKLKLRLQEYSSGKVTKFYESWLENISELVEMIPSINVANDPDLTRISQKLVALTAYSVDDLKESETLRSQIVTAATLVLSQVSEAHRRAA